jgi:hypothetical protein
VDLRLVEGVLRDQSVHLTSTSSDVLHDGEVSAQPGTQPTAQERDQDGIRHRVRDAEGACVDRFHGEQSAVPDAAGVEPKVPVFAWPWAVGQSSAGTRTLSVAGAAKHAGTT